ncbi:MAG: UDP-N-acetylmuramate dehydrogenase [Patescibacteria group bacterium]
MQIQENIPLKDFTAFRIGGPARYFVNAENLADVKEALDFAIKNNLKIFVLGSGSNILVSDSGFDGLVIKPDIKGVEKLSEEGNVVRFKVGSGEDWDKFVGYVVDQGLWGIENLSYIPGFVGGVPMQNVGAYGMEAKDVVESVEVYDTADKTVKTIKNEDCEFGYRESRFNKREKKRYIILDVIFKLQKTGTPNMKYLDVENYMKEKNITSPSLKDMRDAIVYIRKNKLSDPAVVGNAGSFFKNLILNDEDTTKLLENVKKNTSQEVVDNLLEMKNKLYSPSGFKIPTAFLVDKVCGLKGFQMGGVKVHDRQALVLVNESGNATAHEVLALARHIMQTVYEKTGIKIYPEPELVGFTEEELREYLTI